MSEIKSDLIKHIPLLPYLKRILVVTSKAIKRHPTAFVVIGYVFISFLASYILYLRFPNNFTQSNFYAEDAWYVENIRNLGFWKALATPFNGYFIMGTYLLQEASQLVNKLFFDGTILDLPRAISVVSYTFSGFCAALPFLLLRRHLKPIALIWLILVSVFVPLPTMDYGVLGNTANLKFVFAYVALLLIIYRHYLPLSSRKYPLIDALILTCCLTNILVVILIPLMVCKYLPDLKRGFKTLFVLFKNSSFLSLGALIFAVIAMIGVVSVIGEVKPIGGIYDRPYEWKSTIEVFLARSYLFGFMYPLYSHLSHFLTVLVFVLMCAACLRFCDRKYLFTVTAAAGSISLITLVLIWNRPGLSSLFDSYNSAGYDQYFFTQNIIAYLIVAFALSGLAVRKNALYLVVVTCAFLLPLQLLTSSTHGQTNFMAENRGTFVSNSAAACRAGTDARLSIDTYPTRPFVFSTERRAVCESIGTKRNDTLPTALNLQPAGDALIFKPGASDHFTQTFLSKQEGLKGVSFLAVTYGKPLGDRYRFMLMDEHCRVVYRNFRLKKLLIADGAYYPATFPAIKDSQNKKYCFSVVALNPLSKEGFALRLTRPESYPAGKAILNSTPSDRDVVFTLMY
jgi:hypothetical protein